MVGAVGELNNVTVENNYMGFWEGVQFDVNASAGPLGPNVVTAPNTVFDYSNPMWSANAWAAYAPPLGVTPLHSGVLGGHLYGSSTGPSLFVGGYSGQYLNGGTGGKNTSKFSCSMWRPTWSI